MIEAMVQFTRCHQVSITMLSVSGTVSNITLHHSHSHAFTFIIHGTFNLIPLIGTYINNATFASSSSLSSSFNLDRCRSFRISFSTTLSQSFIRIFGGKVMVANGVIVIATIFQNSEVQKVGMNNNSKERDSNNNNPNAYDQGGNQNMSKLNVVTPYLEM
ncbi:AT-hook motif nuclear-localized protein 17 [Spatholobus suberectus]|nr:AT-hook motif nuclear-localized protein 17 [Spatholobus suberectus]